MANYNNFKFTDNNYLILCTIERYERTDSQKNWKSKPYEVTKEIATPEFYTNYITAIPFFNNFENGAYCRASYSYENAGYLPTKITSVSPYKTKKIIATFKFIDKKHLTDSAGWREKEIIKNAKTFDIKYINEHKMITLYTEDDGVTASGIFDTHTKIWRG